MGSPGIEVNLDVKGLQQLEQSKALAKALEPEIRKLEKEIDALSKKGQQVDSQKLDRFRDLEKQKSEAVARVKEIKELEQHQKHLAHEIHGAERLAFGVQRIANNPGVRKLLSGQKLGIDDYASLAGAAAQSEKLLLKGAKFTGLKLGGSTVAAGAVAQVAIEAIKFAIEETKKQLEDNKEMKKIAKEYAYGLVDEVTFDRLNKTQEGGLKGIGQRILQVTGFQETFQEAKAGVEAQNQAALLIRNGLANPTDVTSAMKETLSEAGGRHFFRDAIASGILPGSAPFILFQETAQKGQAAAMQREVTSGRLRTMMVDAEEAERKRLGAAALTPEQRKSIDEAAFKTFLTKFGTENPDEFAKKIQEKAAKHQEDREILRREHERQKPAYQVYNEAQDAVILEVQRRDHYKRVADIIED